jgi:hypothetical protein
VPEYIFDKGTGHDAGSMDTPSEYTVQITEDSINYAKFCDYPLKRSDRFIDDWFDNGLFPGAFDNYIFCNGDEPDTIVALLSDTTEIHKDDIGGHNVVHASLNDNRLWIVTDMGDLYMFHVVERQILSKYVCQDHQFASVYAFSDRVFVITQAGALLSIAALEISDRKLKWTQVELAENERAIYISTSDSHTILIVDRAGKNIVKARGDLGVPFKKKQDDDLQFEDVPSSWFKHEKIVKACCGEQYSLFLSKTGNVYACGQNKLGVCGALQKYIKDPIQVAQYIKDIDTAGYFSVAIDDSGALCTGRMSDTPIVYLKFSRMRDIGPIKQCSLQSEMAVFITTHMYHEIIVWEESYPQRGKATTIDNSGTAAITAKCARSNLYEMTAVSDSNSTWCVYAKGE